jgi:hypothetical protein
MARQSFELNILAERTLSGGLLGPSEPAMDNSPATQGSGASDRVSHVPPTSNQGTST